jgi:MurNAc alpha-1-phosphate uridylyltransferase
MQASKASVVVLAAGRGARMRPLTDRTPKPLLMVQGQTLLDWHLQTLSRQGYGCVLVNTAWLGDQFEPHIARRVQVGAAVPDVVWSHEGADFGAALETAGGIARALPRLTPEFWVLAGDVFTPEFAFEPHALASLSAGNKLAHLWLVPNPPHHPLGDFVLEPDPTQPGTLLARVPAHTHNPRHSPVYTFSTIGVYRRALFELPWCDIPSGNPQGVSAPLAPLLRLAMAAGLVSAELYNGPWTDVGTLDRLEALNHCHL